MGLVWNRYPSEGTISPLLMGLTGKHPHHQGRSQLVTSPTRLVTSSELSMQRAVWQPEGQQLGEEDKTTRGKWPVTVLEKKGRPSGRRPPAHDNRKCLGSFVYLFFKWWSDTQKRKRIIFKCTIGQ
jgi:hypothetical protein